MVKFGFWIINEMVGCVDMFIVDDFFWIFKIVYFDLFYIFKFV